ncbi:MAG: DNA-processing protein DprA [Leptolyngbya sp. SIOISBB]|nr:DNA-processing protein DprA [Leptolyngbya sp. SIOISBB]
MINDFLTEDTKAIILLCGVFGKDRSEKPLSLTEYSSLVRWLIGVNMRPGDLLEKETIAEASMGSGIDKQRLESLLSRGVQLGFAVEEWQRNGIWIISRSDANYPARYKKHLKDKAPPLLFGVGNCSLLSGGGLGIVGSRNVDQAGEIFTRHVAELCAHNCMPVVSGGARGVDQTSMNAALEAGGVTIGILAENLLKKSVERSARQAIADGRLLLLSPYHPNARFSVGTAMSRNKLIYAMSDYGLVVSAEHKKGGTWAGAEEELKRQNSLPVFVRIGKDLPMGNRKLLELGAIPWPASPERNGLRQQLHDLAVYLQEKRSEKEPDLFDFQTSQESLSAREDFLSNEFMNEKQVISELEVKNQESPISIYQAIFPIILNSLDSPLTSIELAESLEVNKTQLNAWLKKMVKDGYVKKLSRPVRYMALKNKVTPKGTAQEGSSA